MAEPAPLTLADLRREIDDVDAQMHALLMRRGRVIDSLIAIKKAQGGGSSFRPLREAQMMRAIAERHRGLLPLDTVEGIWRIIISTFTYVQSPHSVHLGVAGVIAGVEAAPNDLGMLALDSGPKAGAWWRALEAANAPKIIARLPFVERPDHPAGMPVFVIAKPLVDGGAREEVIESVLLDRWRDGYPSALKAIGAEIIGNAAADSGLALLVARPGAGSVAALRQAFEGAGANDLRVTEVGAHAARFDGSSLRPNG